MTNDQLSGILGTLGNSRVVHIGPILDCLGSRILRSGHILHIGYLKLNYIVKKVITE